jgi:predicted P-loop ATPase
MRGTHATPRQFHMRYDFDKIRAEHPLPEVIARSGVELRKNGNEYLGCCPFHADKSPSFSVFTGKSGWQYFCFGCGASGDVIDFAKEHYGYANAGEAARWLMGDDATRTSVDVARTSHSVDVYAGYEITRPPVDAPLIAPGQKTPEILNIKRGGKFVTYTPSMVFPYTNKAGALLGYVIRVEFADKKITPGVWWTRGHGFEGWAHGSYPSPRPLYGLQRMYERADAQVLIVEGEKCADAAQRVMDAAGRNVVAVSWMGGGKAAGKTYWQSLAGRSVVVWPDADDAGVDTARKIADAVTKAGARAVKVMDVSGRSGGWDVADAEAQMSAAEICSFIKERVSREGPQHQLPIDDPQPPSPADRGVRPEPTDSEQTGVRHQPNSAQTPAINSNTWRNYLIMNEKGDSVKPGSNQNVALLLQYEQRFTGLFAWNEFAKEIYLMRRPEWDVDPHTKYPRKLSETDIVACSGFLEYAGLAPKMNDVGRTILRVAEHNKFNPVKDAIDALEWDGVSRIYGDGTNTLPFFAEYFGADNTEINRLFGEKWIIGAIARAMRPGCKMDTMIVLEGPQGLQKSTALQVLSDGLIPGVFTDEMSDPNSKDAGLQMQGRWIIEIAELDSFSRATVTGIKSWLARSTDRFRRPYGKVVEEFPRACVMAGTVNPLGNAGYLKDPTGGRRFWPVETTYIDIERLKIDAKQIWAEGLHLYKQGVKWWLSKEQDKLAGEAQKRRYEDDPWSEKIDTYCFGNERVGLQAIMANCLEIPAERQNVMVTRRITSHMVRRGWERTEEEGRIYYVRK